MPIMGTLRTESAIIITSTYRAVFITDTRKLLAESSTFERFMAFETILEISLERSTPTAITIIAIIRRESFLT